jgi:hypothetical protein
MQKTFSRVFPALWLAALCCASCEDYVLPNDGDWIHESLGTEEDTESDEGSFVGIRFNIPSGGSITAGNSIWLEATVSGDIVRAPEFSWVLVDEVNPDGTELARSGENGPLLFAAESPGRKYIVFRVSAENGTAEKTLTLTVLAKPDTNTLFYFDYGRWRNEHSPAVGTYTVPQGRKLVISPVRHFRQLMDTTEYEWALDGVIQRQDVLFPCYFVFNADGDVGDTHTVTVHARDKNRYGTFQASAETRIRIVESEGTHRRPVGGDSKATAEKVLEFTPAPGQFIRSNGTGYPPVAFVPGITEAEVAEQTGEFLRDGGVPGFWYGSAVSLGAWGGYLVTGFDHSVANIPGSYSFSIEGNSMETWSEPGIVWVSQDENGDGLANDTWFELRASETGKEGTTQLCSITYYEPNSADGCKWEDNMGNKGALPSSVGYPYQTGGGSVIFTGSALPTHLYVLGTTVSPTNIIGHLPYPYGYVDNRDRITDFRISDAMQTDGTPANLAYIDFVKVQCAVSEFAGILGEVSTETGRPVDYQMTH